MGQARVAAVALLCLAGTSARAAVGGAYDTPLGPVVLKKSGGNITGVSAAGGGPCGFKKGQNILKGQLMDDTVSGKLTLCTQGAGCGMQEAFVVLLVARNGDLLSGAVQLKDKTCKPPMEGKGIALARAAGKGKEEHEVPRAARVKKTETAAAHPEKAEPKARPEKEKPVKAEEVTARFGEWNPQSASRTGTGGRAAARQHALAADKLMKTGQFEPARAEFLASIQEDPGYPVPYLGMGVTYFARDNYDDALDWYKKALTVDPDFGDAYYNIACIYSLEKKKPLALRYLRIAVLNGYKRPKDMEADGDLTNIRGEPEYKEILASLTAPAPAAPAEVPPDATDAAPPAPPDASAPTEPPPPTGPVEPPPSP